MDAASDIDTRAKRTRPVRLATWTVSLACLTVAITAFLQLTLVDHFAIRHASDEAGLRLEQLSWQMRDALDRTLDQTARDVAVLSTLSEVRNARDPAGARRVLESFQHDFPDYAWIGIAKPDGRVLAATNGLLENRDVRARPWFHAGQLHVIAEDYHPATLLGSLLPRTPDPWRFVDVAGPIRDADGTLRGVLAIHLSWTWARSVAAELLTPALRGSGAEIIVVRNDGVVLLGPEDLLEKPIATESLRRAFDGDTGIVKERWPDGHTYMTGYSRTGRGRDRAGLRWAILVRQTESAALASARELEHRTRWLCVGLAAVLATLAALLARRIVEPLKVLSGAIEDLAHAPARGTPAAVPQVNSFREAQVLSKALRELVASERTHREALERMNAQLEDTVAARTAELQDMLMRDVLTGLPNRRALMQALPEALSRAARVERPCAVLFIDMDGFKQINDTRGHEEGDELLRRFGKRLRDGIRETDVAARLAGDEFVVVLELLKDAGDAEDKAHILLDQLSRPYVLPSGGVTVGVSIGVALQLPHEPQDTARLLARADQAMYEAKRKGKGRVALSSAGLERETS
ncbi:diguanylate cyclase [Massilia sp. TW-1]|uniref:Diguanylate cyclase n=1 Tax=Telluria antibiotica TaxID=2717319 RepID=A0ABX0PIT7_9BURK|nr:sensor domain-containing diguanylate cyclase [Telluria antibiotica]NIA56732.1 diguanylate cyclase [Telluria antibiotica]